MLVQQEIIHTYTLIASMKSRQQSSMGLLRVRRRYVLKSVHEFAASDARRGEGCRQRHCAVDQNPGILCHAT
jgi:hypothetical protein